MSDVYCQFCFDKLLKPCSQQYNTYVMLVAEKRKTNKRTKIHETAIIKFRILVTRYSVLKLNF